MLEHRIWSVNDREPTDADNDIVAITRKLNDLQPNI
jgi:hypothetical protein